MANNVCRNPQCEYFNRLLPNNAKVCPLCGSPLSSGGGNPEVPKPAATIPPRPTPTAPPVAPIPPRQVRPGLKLIHSSQQEFYLHGEDGCIGRRGQNSTTTPAIDVTGIPHEGIVSRSHARIYWDWSQNAYTIVDHNSRNGTFLNGTPLTREVHYRLNHGDVLQLGQDNLVNFMVYIQ